MDTEESEEVVLNDVKPVVAESFENEVDDVNSGAVDETEESADVVSSQTELVEEESDEDNENFENFPLAKVEHFMANEVFLKNENVFKLPIHRNNNNLSTLVFVLQERFLH